MTEREAFKLVQTSIVSLCDDHMERWKHSEVEGSALIFNAWMAQRKSAIIHLEGVNATKKYTEVKPVTEQLERDPFEDNGDPPAVRAAKEKCKNLLHPGTDPADVDRNLTRLF